MRFAYIDSQGNEVSIPSVDALALRIELGAIGPDTQLYDEQADHWAPAHTHEIFHTLSRGTGDDGFVPPPPVAPPPPAATGDPAPEAEAEAEVEPEPEPEPDPEASTESAAPSEAADELSVTDEPDEASAFDLGDGVELEAEATEEVVDEVAEAASDDLGLGGFDLAPSGGLTEEPEAPDETPPVEFGLMGDLSAAGDLGLDMAGAPEDDAEDAAVEEEEDGGFDFGDMGGLELEAHPEEEEEEEEEDSLLPSSSGMELEEPLGGDGMDFAPAGDDDLMGGGLEMETPMSEFSSDEPPAWMEQSGPEESDEGSMDFASPAAEEDSVEAPAEEETRRREPPVRKDRPEARDRPSPPKRRTSKMPLVMGAVAVMVVGAGGYFGWQALGSGTGGPDLEDPTPSLPEVTIPDIPAELLPTMRDLSEDALSDMVAELTSMQGEFNLPEAPRNDWLSGAYLGTASQYGDLEEYWLGIEAFVDRVRDVDTQVFHDMYVAQVEAAGIAADTAAMLVERADSGFLSARVDRIIAYNQMDDLINAALNLHDFLLNNEADISYEPAAGGISRDPVLEAIPATDALGDEMWDMVDAITGALDNLGTLDRVTTERLFAVLFDRIRRAGIH